MLVLKRDVGETIVVDGDIVVTFLGMDGRKAVLGFEAPDDVEILRSELLQREDPGNG